MNTKTMRLPPRRFLTPSKRKEPDGFINSVKSSITTKTTPPPTTTTTRTTTIPSKLPKPTTAGAKPLTLPPEPAKSNQLLAGYLAHEYLSKGTLFGQPYEPPAVQAESVAKKEKAMSSSQKAEPEPSRGGGKRRVEPSNEDKYERYVEVSGMLKREGGTHIQGIVNPTQLARFLQM